MRAALLCLVVVTACQDEPPPPQAECAGTYYTPYVYPILLSQFPDQAFAIHIVFGSLIEYEHRQDRHIDIDFEYTDTLFADRPVPLQDGDKSYCPEFDPSFKASLDGIETGADIGGWSCSGPGGQVCNFPHALMPISPDDHTQDAVLVISDRSHSISIPLGDSLLERTAAPVGQTDWTFHANQAVAFTWSPSEDLTNYTGGAHGAFMQPPGIGALQLDSVVRTPAKVSTVLPDLVGTGSLALELTRIEYGDAYSIATSQFAFHDASIEP